MEQESTKRFSDDWRKTEQGGVEVQIVTGFEIVQLKEGLVGLLLHVADGRSHLAAIKAGTAKPTNVQLAIQGPFARTVGAALMENAKLAMALSGRRDS